MSRYETLQKAFSGSVEARKVYWSNVEKQVASFLEDFRVYLGVEPTQTVSVDGQNLPAVSLGWFTEAGQFKGWSIGNLPRRSNSMSFAVRVIFGGETSLETPHEFVAGLSISGQENSDVYEVRWTGGFDFPMARGPSFDPMFKALYEAAIEGINAPSRSN